MIIVLCLVGCTSPVVQVQKPEVQESLLVPCTRDTPIPRGITGADLVSTLKEWQDMYSTCAVSKDALIKSI
ncbi:Rz1-like lysis system protein LysC [Rouxiella sp. T17]|uniref:Rz1-like lysis system protein LysC n=1 Tax=Rouxiella sp. T17 TaxID=3085684 RepID=UPI003FA79166